MSGQQQIAEKNSKMARMMNHIALGIGLAIIVAYIVYFVVAIKHDHKKSP